MGVGGGMERVVRWDNSAFSGVIRVAERVFGTVQSSDALVFALYTSELTPRYRVVASRGVNMVKVEATARKRVPENNRSSKSIN